jgi:hypothetical protein
MLNDEDDVKEDLIDEINFDENGEIIEIETDFDIIFKETSNKHKLDGRHSLKDDTILKGNTDTNSDENEGSYAELDELNFNPVIDLFSDDDVVYNKELSEDIYNILKEHTGHDMFQTRTKPNKTIFNNYLDVCIKHSGRKYNKCEIFVELSTYFTDNIFNMFKILSKEHTIDIMKELRKQGYIENIGTVDFVGDIM